MNFKAFLRWALTGNYPAGSDAWDGTPTKVVPAYEHYTPGVPFTAQELNSALNSLAEQSTLAATRAMNNWGPATAVASITGGAALDVMAWDDNGGVWLAAGHSADALVASPDNGASWTGVATPASQVNAIGVFNPGTPGFFSPQDAIVILGGANDVFFYDAAAATLVDSGSTQGITFNSGAVAFGMPGASTTITYGCSWDGTNHRSRFFYCTGVATFVQLTLPTAWQNGPQTNLNYFNYCLGPATDAVIAFGGTTPGTDTSYLLHVNSATFPLSPTFTALTLPAGISGNPVTGVAYNGTSGLFGVMVYDGTNSTLWTSADLTTWTAQTGVISGLATGLSTVGPFWATCAKMGTHPAPTGQSVIYSYDGNDWRRGGLSPVFAAAKMAQGPGVLAVWDASFGAVSGRSW